MDLEYRGKFIGFQQNSDKILQADQFKSGAFFFGDRKGFYKKGETLGSTKGNLGQIEYKTSMSFSQTTVQFFEDRVDLCAFEIFFA